MSLIWKQKKKHDSPTIMSLMEHPDWSPDGSKIVFASFRDAHGNPSGTANIYYINIDGTKIAFKSTRNTKQSAREEICIMDTDGDNVQRLTTTSGWQSDHDPSWSPDSKTIVFMRNEGSRPWTDLVNLDILRDHWQELTPWNAYKVDLNGNRDVMKLTNVDHTLNLPVFSTDGTKILSLRLDFIIVNKQLGGAHHRLILMNPDGSNQEQLIPDDRHTGTLEYFDW